ncbi:Vesicle trafficking between the ER and Golgi [Ceratocystis pirilliformis]|uniref:Vesicle trafficking between the ER and Golgi n=1 Tax=Ceratocystis pirilliformis TaxID=259994 RepID=A0ABR3YWJ9_9PEZI
MASKPLTLRDRQIDALKKILNLNEDVVPRDSEAIDALSLTQKTDAVLNAEGEPIWKVLVFDDLGRDVISSVLRVSDLRTLGVTMHMHLAASRHPIPDVPVVYLVEPTPENLKVITNDLKKGLYSPAYINFMSSLPRPLLEDFAADTAASGTAEDIASLFDQYLNFIVAEPNLFSLGMQKYHTYWALNSAKTQDDELDAIVDRIVSGLLSVVVTMGVIPVIRCPKGAAAEMIAQKLDRKLRDHILNSKDNLFSSASRSGTSSTASGSTVGPTGTQSRPALLILDRNVDLTPMLSHSWTYQSLVHDVLSMKLNRITIETPVDESTPEKGTTKKTYDLTANDFFWARNACLPFPQVAEDIDAELTRYKEDTAEITRKTGTSSLEDLQNDVSASASAQHLKAAITLLPELRERKAVLDMHMNILAAVLSGIKNRQLDNFFQIEENVAKLTKPQVLELIKDADKGDRPLDKLRLFIIWALSTEQEISRAEWASMEEALKAAGVENVSSLPYIRQVRATTKMTQLTTINANPAAGGTSDLFGRFSSISSRLTDRLKETGVSSNLTANLDSLIGGIKNFLPQNRDLTITKILESIMDPAAASSSALAKTENYLYFDPRNAHARGSIPPPSQVRHHQTTGLPGGLPGAGSSSGGPPAASFGQRRQGFSDAIVFTVGGGSMDEYGNLLEWAERTSGERGRRRVVYGSSELLASEDFIKEELERLGTEI